MKAFGLYFRYALRSFVRGRSRSVFGAFCVAVGIASVVALGLVGGNFRDAVTGNGQKMNRGDVSLQFQGQGVNAADYRTFARLKAQGKITDYTSIQYADAILRNPTDSTNANVGSLIGVDPQKFPFYDTVRADQPAGVPLRNLLRTSGDAVVSRLIFDQLHLHIGGPIRLALRFGGARTYTVWGVVPDNAPDPGFGTGLFPYWAMVDHTSMASYDRANNVVANTVYMKTRDQSAAKNVKSYLERRFGPLVSPKTVADVQKDSANGADGMDKFFRMMGLVAVVIGGIGIINTMLVAARRRRREISVLKAIGMKGRQVVLVFTLEALFLALAGTVLGLMMGVGTSVIVNNITQSLAGYTIPWSLHVGPMLGGALVGIVATVLFAYLPVVRASRARPVAALRDGLDESIIRKGFLRRLKPTWQGVRTALLVLILATLMGTLAVVYTGMASGPQVVILGAVAGLGTLLAATVLTHIFVVLVWGVSKFPSFGLLTPRLALRSMGTQKRRLGSTLLALAVGILSIGSVTILAQSFKHSLVSGLEQRNNYNVEVQTPHTLSGVAAVNRAIARLGADLKHRYNGAIANQATLASVDGQSFDTLTARALRGWTDAAGHHKFDKDALSQAQSDVRGVFGQDLSAGGQTYLIARNSKGVALGRNLGPRDIGTNHIVVSSQMTDPLGIKVGSRLVFADNGHRIPFTVVGITDANGNMLLTASNLVDLRYMQRTGLASPAPDHNALLLLDIKSSRLHADLQVLRHGVPNGLVLDLSSFLEFTSVIDKLALFPEIIAALALFAGAIIIANTVALAMLERRREIGVLKAVGATRRTILRSLLIENAVVGFLGATVGVLIAMFAVAMIDSNMFHFGTTYDWPTVAALIGLGMVLAVGAGALTALPASSEKPMSVLRYE